MEAVDHASSATLWRGERVRRASRCTPGSRGAGSPVSIGLQTQPTKYLVELHRDGIILAWGYHREIGVCSYFLWIFE